MDAGCRVSAATLVELGQRLLDLSLALERRPRPGGGEVAPLRELPGRLAQAIDGAVLAAEGRYDASARRTPSRRVGQLLLQPAVERLVEEPRRRRFGEHREQRIDARLDRPLAQQLGAEAVDGADVRFLESLERSSSRVRRVGIGAGIRARPLEPLAQPQLQLAGRLLGERDRDDLADVRAPLGQDREDPVDELGRLAGAGRRFDDQRVVEAAGDGLARRGVGQGRCRCVMASPAAPSGRRA